MDLEFKPKHGLRIDLIPKKFSEKFYSRHLSLEENSRRACREEVYNLLYEETVTLITNCGVTKILG